jgi:hypothetical protein
MQQRGKPPTFLLFFFILGEMTATALRLPSGSQHFNYLTEIIVTVHDRFGDYNESKMTIQVRLAYDFIFIVYAHTHTYTHTDEKFQ